MSQVFTALTVPFRERVVPKPISLCTPASSKPACLSLEVQWSRYLGGAVRVNLTTQGPANLLDKIVSVVIDNTDVHTPVFIRFNDTGDTVNCLAFSTLRVAVLTSEMQFDIFTDAAPTAGERTTIYLTNVYLDPMQNPQIPIVIPQWKMTTGPGLGNIYDTPALGDSVATGFLNLNALGSLTMMVAVPLGGFYEITHILMHSYGIYSTSIAKIGAVQLETVAGTVIQFSDFMVPTDLSMYTLRPIYELQRGNIRLPALPGIRLRNLLALDAGFVDCSIAYSYTT